MDKNATNVESKVMERSKYYMDLYYEVNFVSLITSILAVIASLYIMLSLKKTLILKKD